MITEMLCQWNRIWVVQEVLLPNAVTLCLGPFRAPLCMFSRAAHNLKRHVATCCNKFLESVGVPKEWESLDSVCQELNALAEIGTLFRLSRKLTLQTLLTRFYERHATDTRDMVYGMLSLVTDWGHAKPITPDYSMSLHELFEEVSYRSIQSSFNILSFAGVINQRSDPLEYRRYKWSSWVADWRTMYLNYGRSMAREVLDRYHLYNASCGIRATLPVLYHARCELLGRHALALPGIFVSKLKTVARTDYSSSGQLQNIVRKLPARLELYDTTKYVAGGTIFEAICRTMCWDSIPANSKGGDPNNGSIIRRINPADIQALRQRLDRDIYWDDDVHEFFPLSRKADLKKKVAHFFRTDNDYLGCVQTCKSSEDNLGRGNFLASNCSAYEVFILLGSRVPYIVQPLGKIAINGLGEKQCYQLITDCYVHGIMDGEAIRQQALRTEEIYLI